MLLAAAVVLPTLLPLSTAGCHHLCCSLHCSIDNAIAIALSAIITIAFVTSHWLIAATFLLTSDLLSRCCTLTNSAVTASFCCFCLFTSCGEVLRMPLHLPLAVCCNCYCCWLIVILHQFLTTRWFLSDKKSFSRILTNSTSRHMNITLSSCEMQIAAGWLLSCTSS